MKATIRAAVLALATIAYAAPASAVDFFGYFRDGWTTNSKGGGATCFQTPGFDYKLRLGNECDNYGEWGLQSVIWKDKAGVEVTAGVMFDYDQPVATPTGTNTSIGIQQNYFKIKLPQLAGAQFWGGKQYYERQNIDMIDWFYLNTSDTGIGVEDVDIGFGKLSFSVFGAKGPTADRLYIRPDLRVYGMPINPGGTLTVDLSVTSISRNTDADPKGDNDASAGFWVTVQHNQSGILGGNNLFAAQYANANAANMGGATPGFTISQGGVTFGNSIDKNNMQWRVLDALLLQPNAMFQVLVGGTYQHKELRDGDAKLTLNSYGIFARPKVWLADYFNIQGDIGYTAVKPGGNVANNTDQLNLLKGTVAATLSPSVDGVAGFFVRPEFRVFVTYGGWNDAVNNFSATGASSAINFGDGKKSGVTYGAQVEGWF